MRTMIPGSGETWFFYSHDESVRADTFRWSSTEVLRKITPETHGSKCTKTAFLSCQRSFLSLEHSMELQFEGESGLVRNHACIQASSFHEQMVQENKTVEKSRKDGDVKKWN